METRARKHGTASASQGGRNGKSNRGIRSQAARRFVRRGAESRPGRCGGSCQLVIAGQTEPRGDGAAPVCEAPPAGGDGSTLTVLRPCGAEGGNLLPLSARGPEAHREIDRLLRSLCRNAAGICQFATLAKGCRGEIPLSRSCTLSIDERLVAGDVRAIRDAVTDFIADLEVWIGDYDAAVGDDHETRARLHEVLAVKQRRGELKWDPETGDGGEGSQPDGAAEDSPQRKDGTRRSRRACGRKRCS